MADHENTRHQLAVIESSEEENSQPLEEEIKVDNSDPFHDIP